MFKSHNKFQLTLLGIHSFSYCVVSILKYSDNLGSMQNILKDLNTDETYYGNMFFWFFIFPEARKRKQTFDSVSSLQNSPSGRVLVVALLCLGHLRLIASSVVSSLRPVPIGHRMAGSHAPSSVTHTVCDHSLAGEV